MDDNYLTSLCEPERELLSIGLGALADERGRLVGFRPPALDLALAVGFLVAPRPNADDVRRADDEGSLFQSPRRGQRLTALAEPRSVREESTGTPLPEQEIASCVLVAPSIFPRDRDLRLGGVSCEEERGIETT